MSTARTECYLPRNVAVDAAGPSEIHCEILECLEDEQGGWCKAFVTGFRVAMQMAPAYAAHGADGFMADDAKWDELWNVVRDVCWEDGTKDNEHEGRGKACGVIQPYTRRRLLE